MDQYYGLMDALTKYSKFSEITNYGMVMSHLVEHALAEIEKGKEEEADMEEEGSAVTEDD